MVFLDYASTNPFTKYECSDYCRPFFNANANYAFVEKQMLDEAEERIKTAIGAKGGKVVFGGTASQLIENLMYCVEDSCKSYVCACSAYEHDSVYRFTHRAASDIAQLENTLINYCGEEWKLIVFWQGTNNVTGRVFDVEKIGKLCKEHDAFFVCDMTAMIGHAPIPANIDDWCDCAFWSGHKIGTELGIGAMWLSKNFNDWLGDFKLYGTPNVAGALVIADATADAMERLRDNFVSISRLGTFLLGKLNENAIEYDVICDDQPACDYIYAIRLKGINADALQQYLASKQIYISLGASACAESHDYRVLNAFGLSDQEASEVIRVSFGEDSTANDVLTFVRHVKEFKEKYL